ncbi:MAG: hypothetical protein EON92_09920, partial [Burkholderiales bacterium]
MNFKNLVNAMALKDLYMVGVTRFSLVMETSLRTFVSTRERTLDQAEEKIFATQRLEHRMTLFQNFCLPTYIQFRDVVPNFIGILLVNEQLPAFQLERLRQLAFGTKAFHVLLVSSTGSVPDALRNFITTKIGNSRVFGFRLDDDDALSIHYATAFHQHRDRFRNGTVVTMSKG